MRTLNIMTGTTGINTRVDAARLPHSWEDGPIPMAALVNAAVDRSGRPRRRKGFAKTAASAGLERVISAGGVLYAAGRTAIYRAMGDLSGLSSVTTFSASGPVAWAAVAGAVYWTNGATRGKLMAGTNYDWVKGDDIGPRDLRWFSGPPDGHLVWWNLGRIFVAQRNVVWYSEPLDYGRFALATNFWLFPSTVSMAAPVDGGCYVGDGEAVYFMAGADPAKEVRKFRVADSPPYQGASTTALGRMGMSGDRATASAAGDAGERLAFWMSRRGVHVGGPGGETALLSESWLQELPPAASGCAVVADGVFWGLLKG